MRKNTLFLGFLLAIVLMSCDRKLDVQENYAFTVSHMPYFSNVSINSTSEIRVKLREEAHFTGRSYTLRYFPESGEGTLRIGKSGDPLIPNDKYAVSPGDFRLYYTPKGGGSHKLEIVIESNNSDSEPQVLLLSFTVPGSETGESGEKVPSTESILSIGNLYPGVNGNYYIDGEDTHIKIKNGETPSVTINDDGYYVIDGEDTKIKAKESVNEITDLEKETIAEGVLTPSVSVGKAQVILVSKGRSIKNPKGEEVDNPGVRIEDGSVIYRVYNPDGHPAAHALVKNMPVIGEDYRTDESGYFLIPREDLPEGKDPGLKYQCEIMIGGKSYLSDKTTSIPNRVVFQLRYTGIEEHRFAYELVYVQDGHTISSDLQLSDFPDLKIVAYGIIFKRHHLYRSDHYKIVGNKILIDSPVPATTDPLYDSSSRPFYLSVSVKNAPYGGVIKSDLTLVGMVYGPFLHDFFY